MIVASHPTGNANVYQAMMALNEARLLDKWWTCLNWNDAMPLANWIPTRWRAHLRRRSAPVELHGRIRTRPLKEAMRHLCAKCGGACIARHEKGLFSIDAVYRDLDETVAKHLVKSRDIRGVYCYEDGALQTFRTAQRRGIKCLYDLPIGYWRAAQTLYREESELMPEWADTISGAADSDEKLERKEEELERADCVFVASQFTRNTIERYKSGVSHVHVIPYGSPDVAETAIQKSVGAKLRVLFVGGLTQRKGIAYLLGAVEQMGDRVELTLVGRMVGRGCKPLVKALEKHRWISSLPHSEVLKLMSRSDVLVFPSLFEGFGLVILEAMACGIPVITTANTVGPDVINDGIDGFIVDIRSQSAIAACLSAIDTDRDRLGRMKEAARAAALRMKWQNYRQALTGVIRGVVSSVN